MLLLGTGHCFRDQVLEVCPELSRFSSSAEGIQKTFEGSSLDTIRHMVGSGLGVTVLPATSVPEKPSRDSLLEYIPFSAPAPDRRVVLAWRKSFTRTPGDRGTAPGDPQVPAARRDQAAGRAHRNLVTVPGYRPG